MIVIVSGSWMGFVEEKWTVKLMRFSKGNPKKRNWEEKGGDKHEGKGTMRFKLALPVCQMSGTKGLKL